MKRFASFSLALILTLACMIGVVSAANDPMSLYSSPTITMTSASAHTGTNTGEVDFDFRITPTDTADLLGVSSIVVHKPDGSTYTVWGSVGNGFIGSGIGLASTYTYKGESGKSYYADVTFFSTIGSVTDSRTVRTRSVTAR